MSKQPANNSLESVNVTLGYIQRDVTDINSKLDKSYVTKEEFAPVKTLVYGMVGLVLTAVAGALITLVLRN